jgi:spermidine/putrescine-binding protein
VQADEVNLYLWQNMLSEQMLVQFEQQTGHRVKQTYFENEMLRDEFVVSGRAEKFDLIMFDDFVLNLFGRKGLMHDFSQNDLSNRANNTPSALAACGKHGIPYAKGTIGIAYRASKVSTPMTSWRQVLDPPPYLAGRILVPNDELDTIGIALLALHYSPYTNDQNELKQAYELLKKTQRSVKDFRDASGYFIDKQALADVDVAVVYSGDTHMIAQVTQQDDWVYIQPEEGTLVWYQCLASLVANKPSEATLAFLEFINDADLAAQNAQQMWFATTNDAALKKVSNTYLSDQELFPVQLELEHKRPSMSAELEGVLIRNRIMNELGY